MSIKTHMVGLRLDDEEITRLHTLAKHFGLGTQQVLRMILKNEADAIMGMNRQGSR